MVNYTNRVMTALERCMGNEITWLDRQARARTTSHFRPLSFPSLVRDDNKRVIYFFAGLPGSCHDVTCLRRSALWRQLNSTHLFDDGHYLLGDSGYVPLEPLVCSYKRTGGDMDEVSFNTCIANARSNATIATHDREQEKKEWEREKQNLEGEKKKLGEDNAKLRSSVSLVSWEREREKEEWEKEKRTLQEDNLRIDAETKALQVEGLHQDRARLQKELKVLEEVDALAPMHTEFVELANIYEEKFAYLSIPDGPPYDPMKTTKKDDNYLHSVLLPVLEKFRFHLHDVMSFVDANWEPAQAKEPISSLAVYWEPWTPG
ncbi:hypothetical protein R1sor_027018 [Riccia sorocarpa]|uniref:DDE Tnp4 domain-containing protein n=1 Tax=Riccia sorocarpa TaxID=122646 RepID=A0ABD3GD28_9MARC